MLGQVKDNIKEQLGKDGNEIDKGPKIKVEEILVRAIFSLL